MLRAALLAIILLLAPRLALAQEQPVVVAPSGNASWAIVPAKSAAAASSLIIKATAGNLYGAYVTTGATAGYLMIFNAATAPGDGAVTPIECVQAPANSTVSIFYQPGPPAYFSTGIVAVFSSTGCFTKTASATAFLHGLYQ